MDRIEVRTYKGRVCLSMLKFWVIHKDFPKQCQWVSLLGVGGNLSVNTAKIDLSREYAFSTAIFEYWTIDPHLNHLRHFLKLEMLGPHTLLLNQNLWEMNQRTDILNKLFGFFMWTQVCESTCKEAELKWNDVPSPAWNLNIPFFLTEEIVGLY